MDFPQPRLLPAVLLSANVFLGVAALAQPVLAPSADTAVRAPTVDQHAAFSRVVLGDQRVRAAVGAGDTRVVSVFGPIDKAQAEAFLTETSAQPPTRPVQVFVFNPQTNRAALSIMSPRGDTVAAVQQLSANEFPFMREDADQALALVRANADAKRALGADLDRFVITDPGTDNRAPFAAQALPVRGTATNDPCTNNRCVDIIFRTEIGYLGVRALVDLTKRTVTVARDGGQH